MHWWICTELSNSWISSVLVKHPTWAIPRTSSDGYMYWSRRLPWASGMSQVPLITSTASNNWESEPITQSLSDVYWYFLQFRANLATDLQLGGRSFSVGQSGPRLMVRIPCKRFGCQCPCRPANLLKSYSCLGSWILPWKDPSIRQNKSEHPDVYASSETSIVIVWLVNAINPCGECERD